MRRLLLVIAMLLCASAASAANEKVWGTSDYPNPYGMNGSLATWQTVEYMRSMTHFEGLDSTIPWARYWIDPYNGDDSNAGTYEKPIKTIGQWKEMAGFGTWFTIKNGGRDRPMYISNQTFPYPTSEACVVGETITYDGGGSTSRILDIDVAAGVFVVETLTGNALAASDVISSGSQTGASCAWTVGTREPSIWDGSTTVCNTDPTTACTVGGGCTRGGSCVADCGGGSTTCVGHANAAIMLETTPTRYDGRIVSIIDAEDPSNPPIIHADKQQPSEDDADDNGLFMTRGSSAYGCLGVANIHARLLQNDFLSQHDEGCVKALNTYATVFNDSADLANNVVTTHGGSSGRGQVVSVNGGGTSVVETSVSGSPVAPTGSAATILIGADSEYTFDAANWTQTNVSAATLTSTGGRIALVGGDFRCQNLVSANPFGCLGVALTSSSGTLEFNAARSIFRTLPRAGVTTLGTFNPTTASTGTIQANLYRVTLDGNGTGWLIRPSSAGGRITLNGYGMIFDNASVYVRDIQTDASLSTVNLNGVYDDDGSNRWFVNNANHTTAAAASSAGGATWSLFETGQSVQTDSTEFTSDFRCASTGECWDAYTEINSFEFPEVVYDYLAVPITGYYDAGSRNYGAR